MRVRLTAYEDNGQIINLYLNIRTKGAYTKDWIDIYSSGRGFLTQSNPKTQRQLTYLMIMFPFWNNIPQGGTVDFQVEALIGSVHRIVNGQRLHGFLKTTKAPGVTHKP